MTADYAHGLYLDRGSRGVEDETEARVADAIRAGTIRLDELDRQTLAIRRTERALSNTVAIEVSPAGVAAVEALAASVRFRAIERAVEFGSPEWWDAMYQWRDTIDGLAS